jgi:toxin YoeB
MNLLFTERGWTEYIYWQQHDPRLVKKINELLRDCARTPFSGLGKPEALRENLSGWWSRRISDEHRLVYRVDGDDLIIAQCRFHYRK